MGKKILVTPEILEKTSGQLETHSQSYSDIAKQLMQTAQTMGAAWEGDDNLAFVDQITGFTEDLDKMAQKLSVAGQALKQIKDNYVQTQQHNITQVRKLQN